MDATIANERLRKRFAKWDVDGSGSLERADFEKEAMQIARSFGKDPEGPEARELRDAFVGMFTHLAEQAGIPADGSLSEDQFVEAAGKLVGEGAEASFNRVLGPVMRGIVGLCDKNADGQINGEEFATWLTAIGVDRSQAGDAFQKVDTNGNGELSVDELLAAVRAFHFGELDVELLG